MRFSEIISAFNSRDASRSEIAATDLLELAQKGLSVTETAELALAISRSGKQITLPTSGGPYADVPSSGGPASLTTLLCPILLAANGVMVPKISATGGVAGAIDTLALIPHFRMMLTESEFNSGLKKCGIAHIKQSDDVCPLDQILIDLRRRANMMSNRWLAVSSLLAKKLAVPGTLAVFDLRVGTTGNLGSTFVEVEQAAELFFDVATLLDISIGLVLTDNRTFPCSALGRCESLDLLYKSLRSPDALLSIDEEHIKLCVNIAAHTSVLAGAEKDVLDARKNIWNALRNLKALDRFSCHVVAQGGTIDGLQRVLKKRSAHAKYRIFADRDGIWQAPDLESVVSWLKQERRIVGTSTELGISLLKSPNSQVYKDEALLEVFHPTGLSVDDEMQLRGSIVDTATEDFRREAKIMMPAI